MKKGSMVRMVRIICRDCFETHTVKAVGPGKPKLCDACRLAVAEAHKMAQLKGTENGTAWHKETEKEKRAQRKAREAVKDAPPEPVKGGIAMINAAIRLA